MSARTLGLTKPVDSHVTGQPISVPMIWIPDEHASSPTRCPLGTPTCALRSAIRAAVYNGRASASSASASRQLMLSFTQSIRAWKVSFSKP